MAKARKATLSSRAADMQEYRKRLAKKAEPEIRSVDIACMKALASFSAAAKAEGSGSESFQLLNRLLTDVTGVLSKQGFDKIKATEVLARRLSFLVKETKRPDADAATRKKWSPPLPSNRVKGYTDDEPF
ncbi:hypothetical protein [Rhizobium ruizarguesonis]|uniref:hypothetical protein n=1 Tax=Rhizobium ruizarguesonis TaxID=2081791 RepID=UPI00102F90D0|nr:hypothetical protein [Rhizobium ruizarguesonis]TAV14741.1 hypothetical protein ELI34_04335 [Rhizobium ruizarguesonis]